MSAVASLVTALARLARGGMTFIRAVARLEDAFAALERGIASQLRGSARYGDDLARLIHAIAEPPRRLAALRRGGAGAVRTVVVRRNEAASGAYALSSLVRCLARAAATPASLSRARVVLMGWRRC